MLEYAAAQQRVRTTDVMLQALELTLDRLTKRDEMRVGHGSFAERDTGGSRPGSRGRSLGFWVRLATSKGGDGGDAGDNA